MQIFYYCDKLKQMQWVNCGLGGIKNAAEGFKQSQSIGSSTVSKQAKDTVDRGRNKVDIQEGVIQNAYPSVFTILIDDERDENPPQLLSFSYTDIITRDIRMKLC